MRSVRRVDTFESDEGLIIKIEHDEAAANEAAANEVEHKRCMHEQYREQDDDREGSATARCGRAFGRVFLPPSCASC